MGKGKAKEKDDLSTPRRSSGIAKAKNTNTKNLSRRKKASKTLALDIILQKERRH